MTDEREYDDMQRDTPDRARMEMSGTGTEGSDQELNPDFHPDRMDLRAKDDMRSTDATRDDADPVGPSRMRDVDPMSHDRNTSPDDMRNREEVDERENMRDANAVRADERTGTRAGMVSATGAGSGRAAQADLWPEMGDLRQKFDSIQSEFIDDPRSAVRKAEQLLNEVVDRITRSMRDRVDSMRSDAGKNADTEQLRQTMRGYRELVVWMDTRRAA